MYSVAVQTISLTLYHRKARSFMLYMDFINILYSFKLLKISFYQGSA